MRPSQRLIAATMLMVFSVVLAGCSSSLGSDFDPTDLLDWLDTKKKLPGKREPVFPDGVPGMEQGVPKEMYKGAQQDNPNAQALAEPAPQAQPQPRVSQQPLEPPPGSPQALKKAKAKAKEQSKEQATAAAPAAAEPDGETAAASQDDGSQAAPPAPKKKIVRRRTTAPPPDPNAPAQAAAPQSSQPAQAAQGGAFPAPLPGGQFSR